MKVSRASIGLVLIFTCYIVLLWWGDRAYRVFDDLAPFFQLAPLVAVVSLVTYAIRFTRWHNLLRWAGYTTPWLHGFLAYLSGFAFTATPGKVGELARIRYLQPLGVQAKDVISVFILERTLDIVVVLLLSLMVAIHGSMFGLAFAFVVCFVGIVGGLAIYGRALEPVSLWLTRLKMLRLARGLDNLRHAFIGLRRWSHIQWLISFALGLCAWLLTALSFVIVLHGLGIGVAISSALGMYPLAMLVGAASMLPGGLGTTEAAIVAQLQLHDVPMDLALAVAVVIRLGTLWFAVLVGGLAVLILESFSRLRSMQDS
jgi:uncharacterized protein (TIRG00374 family)